MSIRSQVNKLEEQNPNFGVYSKQSLEAKNEAEKIPYLINGDYYILRNGAFRPVVNAGTLAELLGRDMSKATSNAKTLSVEEAQKIAPVGGAEATIQVIKDIGQLKSGETFTDPNSPFNYQVGESGNLKQIGEARYNPTTKYAQEQAKGAEANRIADEAKYGINVSQGTDIISKNQTTVQATQQPTSQLQFKTGLTTTQKTELQNRLDSIKNGSQITQTDINNFNYGLGSSWQSYIPEQTQSPAQTPSVYSDNPIIQAIVDQIKPEQLAEAKFEWTDILQNEAKKIAEADFGPYYTRMFEIEQANLKSGLAGYEQTYSREAQDTQLKKEELNREYDTALQAARRNYASSGLAYSSERIGKEGELASSLTRGLTAQNTALGRTQEDVKKAEQELLAKGELRLGTEAINKEKSEYQYTSPLSSPYSGELELEKRKAIAEDIQRQKSNYLQSYV